MNLNPFLHTFVNNSKVNVEQHNTESNQIKTEMEHYPEMTNNSERKAEFSHKLQTRPRQVTNRIEEHTNEANATPDQNDQMNRQSQLGSPSTHFIFTPQLQSPSKNPSAVTSNKDSRGNTPK